MGDAFSTSPQSSPLSIATSHQSKGVISYGFYSTIAFFFHTKPISLIYNLPGSEVYEFKTLICQSLSFISLNQFSGSEEERKGKSLNGGLLCLLTGK